MLSRVDLAIQGQEVKADECNKQRIDRLNKLRYRRSNSPTNQQDLKRNPQMKPRTKILCTVFGVTLLAACASTFEATHDHDADHDFSSYQTFAWISKNPMKVARSAAAPNPLLEPRIMGAIESGLEAKGYRLVNTPKSADFVVSFTVGSREEIKVDSYPTMTAGYGRPAHWGWGSAYYGYGTETTVRQYTKGMLAVDVFDVTGRRPVWHGVATKTINESDREDMEATIKAAADAVLAGFPPQ